MTTPKTKPFTQRFFFINQNSGNKTILPKIEELFEAAKATKTDLAIEISHLKGKRSNQQLRGFWKLITELAFWMNSKGNHFTKDQVAEWVKIQSGFCNEIEDCKVGKSLAKRGDATKEDAQRILDFILCFAAENGIEGCFLESRETEEFCNYFNLKKE